MSAPPSTLGQYQIIREIARSNDIVYEAYDPTMNRRVAVKELVMPGGATAQQQDERIQRFKREAQAAGTLNHPNIMTVYSFAEDAGRSFMAMEFLDGHNLRNEIDTKGFLTLDRACEIAIDILAGLGHAHSKGVIHRDIKPDNIQLLSNGSVKITDFGIARLTFQPNLTLDGQVFGTPSYMSPEQVVGRDIDARSDLFSVGTLLYEMMTGQKPFSGDSVVAITYAIMNNEPVQPAQIPWRVWEVIYRSLDKSPVGRYASAEAMSQALSDAVNAQTSPAPDPVASPYGYSVPPPAAGAPPIINPYGSTPPPAAGGVSYAPYNPYGNPSPSPYSFSGQNQYQQPYGGPSMPPPGTPPAYFPPPPRRPLLKPETEEFLKKLLLYVIVIGSLLALLVVGLSSLAEYVQRVNAERQDQQLRQDELATDSRVPVNERIQRLEDFRGKLQSPAKITEANRRLAALYEEEGQSYLAAGKFAMAENSFKNATTLDPYDPALYTDLASLYEQQAQAESDKMQRATLWMQAGENWQTAANKEINSVRRKQFETQTALNYYNYANDVTSVGDASLRSEARQALYEARRNAPSGSDLAVKIDALLANIR